MSKLPSRTGAVTLPSPSEPLKIALVEDKPEMRESWLKLINSFPDSSCECVCVSGEEALRILPTAAPDVVLMDIFLPRMSGIECTARLKELLPQTQVVILTGVDDDEMVFLALEAGADGYLLKRPKPSDLRSALLDVRSGGAPMSSEVARRVVESFRQRRRDRDEGVHLTVREEEILVLLSKGYSNREIAEQISISVDTVRTHLKHTYEKMHVRSRAEALAHYMASKPPAGSRGHYWRLRHGVSVQTQESLSSCPMCLAFA